MRGGERFQAPKTALPIMKAFIHRRPHLLPCLLTAAALVYAIGDRPYAVYQVLRVVTTATAALLVALGAVHRRWWVVWLFGVVALLFNPFAPIRMTKADWRVIDGVSAGLFTLAAITVCFGPQDRTER